MALAAKRRSARLAEHRKGTKRLGSKNVSASKGPIIKWVGGKKRLLSELLKRVPSEFGQYIEPFAGGAALFHELSPAKAILSDFNSDLINTYDAVAWNVEGVIRRLAHHQRKHSEEHFYQMRTRWNARLAKDKSMDRAALFIYLNKTCFNGLWRVNRKGEYNVPMGRYSSPTVCDKDSLRSASPRLRRAKLLAGDFRKALESTQKGDFVYLDPPYQPASKTSNFTGYTESGFGESEQEILAKSAFDLAQSGAKILLSNSDTPLIRKLYKKAKIERVSCSRAINSNASKRGPVGEVLVTIGY